MENRKYIFVILLILGACIIFSLYRCGTGQNRSTGDRYVFCRDQKGFQLGKACDNKYSSITLKLQDLECKQSATWFSGVIAVNVLKKELIGDKVKIRLAFTNESHGPIPLSIECKEFGIEKYDIYCTGKDDDIIFIPNKGFSHIKYPIDDYEFGLILSFETKEIANLVDKIIIYNRTNTFNVVENPKVEIENEKIKIENLKIKRTKLIPIFYYIFAAFIIMFFVALYFEQDTKTLAISISAIFFSIFSVRNVIDKDIKMFPTYLDYFIIFVLLSFTLLLLRKITKPKVKELKKKLTLKLKRKVEKK